MQYIDPHIHCRDWEQDYKATIKDISKLAKNQGIISIFDMPNTNPPIISKTLVEKRLRLAEQEGCLDGYFLYIGATKNPEQIREASEIVKNNPRVVGIKMYAGRSVGDLAITSEEDQAKIYRELVQSDYKNVLAVHCEKEKLFKMDLWKPDKPETWNLVRPKEAEVESVGDQMRMAKKAGFKGILHICHVSTPQAVEIVQQTKSELKATCGVTPHHIFYSTLNMKGRKGLRYKVNPPLRDYATTLDLRKCLKEGKIDWIESDHAPHTRDEKLFPPYMSGIQSLRFYSVFLDYLMNFGFTEEQIFQFTNGNIKKVFNIE